MKHSALVIKIGIVAILLFPYLPLTAKKHCYNGQNTSTNSLYDDTNEDHWDEWCNEKGPISKEEFEDEDCDFDCEDECYPKKRRRFSCCTGPTGCGGDCCLEPLCDPCCPDIEELCPPECPPGPRGPRGTRGPRGRRGRDARNCSRVGEVTFTSFDMTTKQTKQVPFFTVYDVTPQIALRAWPLAPCSVDPVSLSFAIPKDFDHDGETRLELHFLVQKSHQADPLQNKQITVRVQGDFIGQENNLGTIFPFSIEKNVCIDEPTSLGCEKLRHYRVSIPLNTNLIEGQDFAILAIDRVFDYSCSTASTIIDTLTGAFCDYPYPVYLAGATFSYHRSCEK